MSIATRYSTFKDQARKVWALSLPYFQSEQKWKARLLLAAVMALNLAYVYLSVQFNEWNRVFYDAIQNKQADVFWKQMGVFCILAAFNIAIVVYRMYLTQILDLRWREWMTHYYLERWTQNKAFYHLELARFTSTENANALADNPDQRIQEDAKQFTDLTVSLTMGFLLAVVNMAAFIGILWGLSGGFEFKWGGHTYVVIGFMVWLALLYSAAGSIFTHLIGKPLVGLNFEQQKREANFRHHLVRVREYSESIALSKGEMVERNALQGRFASVVENTLHTLWTQKRLTWFTAGYGQAAVVFPFIIAAPRYFSGAIQLGELMQIGNSFGEVQGSMSWLVNNYSGLATWKATTDRLTSFEASLRTVEAQKIQQNEAKTHLNKAQAAIETVANNNHLELNDITLSLPNGTILANHVSLSAQAGDSIIVSGPSGSGKSTLFRTIAGIWPYSNLGGGGRVNQPADFAQQAMFIPQRPYFPNATLRAALAYPDEASTYSDDALRTALYEALLPHLKTRLNDEEAWSQKLSGGEQQRLALARVFLKKPRWVFADEATSALDEAAEKTVYERLLAQVKSAQGALISIAHRPAVAGFHTTCWRFEPTATGAEAKFVISSAAT
jgi:vitamin B12/bleomycin/antimicrobial peptide transport system ATP-binding/permease protein